MKVKKVREKMPALASGLGLSSVGQELAEEGEEGCDPGSRESKEHHQVAQRESRA
jgi:hypothetical protein